MQIAQVLSGYSLGEADLLRRAMGKKIKEEMDAAARALRRRRGRRTAWTAPRAEYIFELVAKFAGYGFNKSHAAAYALIAYQTAYFKANYPVEFMAASMTLDMGNTDKLERLRAGSAAHGHRARAALGQSLRGADSCRRTAPFATALAALKNVGQQAVEHLCARAARRTAPSGHLRFRRAASIHASSTSARWRRSPPAAPSTSSSSTAPRPSPTSIASWQAGARSLEASSEGQNDLFSGGANEPPPIALKPAAPGSPIERLSKEFEAVGFFLTGHPLDDYQDILCRSRRRDLGGLRREGADPTRRRHACRDRARRARAQGQDRQCFRLRRLLRSDRPVRGRVVLRGACRVAAAARSRHGRAAGGRGGNRRRNHQDPRASPDLARGCRGKASSRACEFT